jgi:hypothetical protein
MTVWCNIALDYVKIYPVGDEYKGETHSRTLEGMELSVNGYRVQKQRWVDEARIALAGEIAEEQLTSDARNAESHSRSDRDRALETLKSVCEVKLAARSLFTRLMAETKSVINVPGFQQAIRDMAEELRAHDDVRGAKADQIISAAFRAHSTVVGTRIPLRELAPELWP